MKIEITPKDYKDYYEAVDWDPVVFEKLLRHLNYDFGNLIVSTLLDLRESRITHLVGVKETDNSLWLTNSAIESLGNLQKVGGNLYLRNTPLSQKYSEEEIVEMVKVNYTIYI